MSITAYEKETIINYNEADDMADVYTHEKALQRHIEKELGVKPFFKEGAAREYTIPKKWLRYPLKPRKASPAQREVLAKARLKARQAQKTP